MIQEVLPPTLIAEGSRMAGTLTFTSHTHVFGIIEGDVAQQTLESLHVGRSGWVHGAITSQGPVFVEGRVDGNITSTTQIHLLPTAIVHGKLSAPSIVVRAGAIFEGELEMEKRRPQPHKRAA